MNVIPKSASFLRSHSAAQQRQIIAQREGNFKGFQPKRANLRPPPFDSEVIPDNSLLVGLLAYWTLQDNFGQIEVFDVNGQNALVNGTFQSYVSARIGNGARTPTNNVFQENVLNTAFNLNEFTVSFWFVQNSNNNFSVYNIIRKFGDDGGGNDGWRLQVSTLDNVAFSLAKNGTIFGPAQAGPLIDGELYFFALRYRLSDTKAIFSFYDTLALIAQNESVNSNYEPSTTTKLILCDSPGGLSMTTDELAIWNRALTDLEVDKLWNNGLGLAYPFI